MEQLEMVLVARRGERNDEGVVTRDRKELYRSELVKVEKPSTRENVLRREEVYEATKGVDGFELEVSAARVPFHSLGCGDC